MVGRKSHIANNIFSFNVAVYQTSYNRIVRISVGWKEYQRFCYFCDSLPLTFLNHTVGISDL